MGETTATEGDGSGGTRTTRTATGSGPATWFHDGTRNGIADYVGDVWKWMSGLRVYKGEIQIFVGNLAAKQVSHLATSTYWKAILPNGSLVEPGTPGTLKYTKDFKIANRYRRGRQYPHAKLRKSCGRNWRDNDPGDLEEIIPCTGKRRHIPALF